MYQSGLHIISTLQTIETEKISKYESFQLEINSLIEKFNMQNLGGVFHDFSPQGFTAVVCLSESHISIHTWPEYNKINIDIYLSNFARLNNKTVESIFTHLVSFFNATIVTKNEILR